MGILKVDNLSVGYGNNVVLKDVSFEINKGDYVSILGKNGSGKSTLMKTLLGLQAKLGGTIEYSNDIKKNGIGYLPQQTVVQKDFPATVKEVVLAGFIGKTGMRPFYTREEKRIASEFMEKVQITDLANKCYRELSGGQQQRVLLARALCATDKVLLLDEPVAGLDPQAIQSMYDLLTDLNNAGTTIIIISHDIPYSMQLSNKLILVENESVTVEENSTSSKREVRGGEDV